MYLAVFPWHCVNHRLEIVVADAVKQATTINHFKHFLDSIYSLFSQWNKNQRELSDACRKLQVQFVQIGRELDMRWVCSSLRTVSAVCTCYGALVIYFICLKPF